MCSGPEQSNPNSSTTNNQEASAAKSNNMKNMSLLSVETEDSFSSLLEFAANNDVEAFRRYIELDLSAIDEPGLWYIRKKGSKQITQEERTPLMVAATFGSVDVLKLIVALPEVDLNKSCGQDKWTSLHCAASGGSVNSFDVIKLLLSAGADPNIEDVNGLRPADVIVAPPKLPGAKSALEDLLMNNISDGSCNNLRVSISNSSNASSPVLSSSPESSISPSSPADRPLSEKKQYPIDPSLPDIRNSIYSTDEFRMFSFKVRPCSRAYSHDWTECPFVHPGENARRRDPRKFHYSCVPCPDFRKGACRRSDMCEYAHGVFECWLHPAQYRTRLCKDGTGCARQVCFFAHTQDELRPLYVSTGSGVPSPRSVANQACSYMDMAAALSHLPGSPTLNGMSHTSQGWPQPNVPTLHLPGSNLQSSRLRSSLSARDIPPEDLNMFRDFNDFNDMSWSNSSAMLSRSVGQSRSKPTLTPSNLDELFSAEVAMGASSSPRFSDQGVFSPTHHKPGLLLNNNNNNNQFQQQQSVLSPINTTTTTTTNNNHLFSPRNVVEHPLLMQGSFNSLSPRMMSSPRSLEAGSPMSARFAQMHSNLGGARAPINVGSPGGGGGWSKWGSPTGKADWSVGGDDLRKSSTFLETNDNNTNINNNDGDEPDLSWVQSLVKESSPPEMMMERKNLNLNPPAVAAAHGTSGGPAVMDPSGECLLKSNSQIIDSIDNSVLGAWLEQMQLDQLVV